jgi:uncharacterized YigZ family protein
MISTKDSYLTLKTPGIGLFKDKGSKFIASVFPMEDEEQFERELSDIREQHIKARHFCTAFRLGPLSPMERFNDDGEPSGSAGRPILGQLHSANLLRVGAVVVRYFGGTKLGVSGLIEAYRESTAAAIQDAKIIQKEVKETFCIECSYAQMPHIMEAFKFAQIDILQKEFSSTPEFLIALPLSQVESSWNRIATHFVGHSASRNNLEKDHNMKINTLTIE